MILGFPVTDGLWRRHTRNYINAFLAGAQHFMGHVFMSGVHGRHDVLTTVKLVDWLSVVSQRIEMNSNVCKAKKLFVIFQLKKMTR